MKPGETTFRQKIESVWKSPNNTILKYIENSVDDRGFPNIQNWKDYKEGKDEVELYSTLMYFLLNKKLPLPNANESEYSIRRLFFKFKNSTVAPFVHHYDLDKPLIHRLSGNRNTQYEHDYDNWSMGFFPQHITANKISNYFAENERMKCEITNRESPTFLWTTEHGMSRLMDCIRRVGIDNLNEKKLKKAFGYAGQVATQFNGCDICYNTGFKSRSPVMSHIVIDETNAHYLEGRLGELIFEDTMITEARNLHRSMQTPLFEVLKLEA